MNRAALALTASASLAAMAIVSPSRADNPMQRGGNSGPGERANVGPAVLRAGGAHPRPTNLTLAFPKATLKNKPGKPGSPTAPPPPPPAPPLKTPPGALGEVFKIIPGYTPTYAPGVWTSFSASGLLFMTSGDQPVFQMRQHTSGMDGVVTINITPDSPKQNLAFSCAVSGGTAYSVAVDAYYIGTGGASGDHDTLLLNETTGAPSGNIIVSYEAITPPPSFVSVFVSSTKSDWQLIGCQGFRMP
jgi:hypothetical protein